ncbi:MAG: hypothetical protein IVW51_11135 [Thermaceae bacterium]|nr:hypothetical protein [Thermaceae bacterium]
MDELEFDTLPPEPSTPTQRATDDVSTRPMAEPVISLSQAVVGGEPKPEGEGATSKTESKPLKDEDLIAIIAQISSMGLAPDLADRYAKDIQSDPLLNWGFGMIGMADALEKMGFNGSGQSLPPWMRVAGGLAVAGWVVMQTRGRYGQPVSPNQTNPAADGVRAPDFSGAYATTTPNPNPQTGGENG